MSSRKHYLSPAHAFAAIRNQICFDDNSNIEVRAAIRAEMPYAMQYAINISEKHKYDLDGFSTSNYYFRTLYAISVNREEIILVRRFSDEQFAEICLNLKFKCPICNGKRLRPNYRSPYLYALTEGTTIVCNECHRDNLAIAKHQLSLLSSLVKLLKRGDVTDEEYERIARRAYSGFDRLEVGKNNASGSTRKSLSGEEHHRHSEAGNSSVHYAHRQLSAGLAATHEAIFRRGRIMLERYS